MQALHKLLENMRRVSAADFFKFMFEQKDVQEKVFELMRKQLGRGERGDEGEFKDYSGVSIDLGKPTRGNPFFDSVGGDAIRLYDTGAFYKSFRATLAITGETFIYQADTLKTDDDGSVKDLANIYGRGAVMDLADESVGDLLIFIGTKSRDYFDQLIEGKR